jgi:two-component sensor histidine kinase/PAS domain-containing protein
MFIQQANPVLTNATYSQRHIYRRPYYLAAIIMLIMFFLEILVMYIVCSFTKHSLLWMAVMSSLLFTIVFSPALYFFILKPLILHIKAREKSENELIEHRNHLEKTVKERTSALTNTNEKLRIEIKERKQVEKLLKESEIQLRTAIDSIPFHFFAIDKSGHYFLQNNKIKEDWGDIIGKRPEEVALDKETIALWQNNNRRAFAGEIVTGEVSFQVGEKKKHFYNIISPIRRGDEIFGVMGLNVDITEQKKAEIAIKSALKEKEILLREIHHRTKNNMEVICNLFSLQAAYVKNKQVQRVFTETKNRIRSMALVHEKLYQAQDLANFNLNDYINDLTSSFMKNIQFKQKLSLKLEIDDILVSIDTAIPFGLILNELITNSLKHAFPGKKEGEIRIALHQMPDGLIEFAFGDNGIGLPKNFDLRNTQTLGLQLVFNLAEKQLKGKIETISGKGTNLKIYFKQRHI